MIRYAAIATLVSVGLSICWFGGQSLSGQDPGSDIAPSTEPWFDPVTKPFVFRAPRHDQWPLVATGEETVFSVSIRSLPKLAHQELMFRFNLVRVEDAVVVSSEQTEIALDASGDSKPIPIKLAALTSAGVYEIRCQLEAPQGSIWTRLKGQAENFASTTVPLLVCDTSIPKVPVSPDAFVMASNPIPWRQRGPVEQIDPGDFASPAWIPNGANRLVPNVRRVGETLTPWRSDAVPATGELLSGKNFVGLLPNLVAHQPYQLAITLGEVAFDYQLRRLRVEFSNSPLFDKVNQSNSITVNLRADLSATEGERVTTYNVLHFANRSNEFVRITNESTGASIPVQSITLSESLHGNPKHGDLQDVDRGEGRHAMLVIKSIDWVNTLSSDYDSAEPLNRFSDSTIELFRVWVVASRLAFHARWAGYDQVTLPEFWAAATEDGGRFERRWMDRLGKVAFEKWGSSPSIDAIRWVSPHAVGSAKESISDEIALDGTEAFCEIAAPPVLFVVDALTDHGRRDLTLCGSRLPMVMERTFSEAIAEFRDTPVDSANVPSSLGSGADYVCVLTPVSHQSPVLPITIVNTATWTSRVDLQFSNSDAADCKIVRQATTNAVLLEHSGSTIRSLLIPPSAIVNLRASNITSSSGLVSWNASMVGGDPALEKLKQHVGQIVGKIGTLALPEDYNGLRNGSFEQQGAVGIVGWMHTQFPATAVMLDTAEAIDGSNSIRMTANDRSAGRTWLVSEPVTIPPSGRLAVSLAARAEAKSHVKSGTQADQRSDSATTTALDQPDAASASKSIQSKSPSPTQLVRVSLEGIRAGKPVRFASEFEVPCDGQWQPRKVVLETDNLNTIDPGSLRLTVDSLSPGRLWVDDIHLHDQFAMHSERTALQGKAFLAIQGLQRGNLKPAAQLLNNNWSGYLLSHTNPQPPDPTVKHSAVAGSPKGGRATAELAQQSKAGSMGRSQWPVRMDRKSPPGRESKTAQQPKIEQESEAEKQSVAERLRDWLPRPIRF